MQISLAISIIIVYSLLLLLTPVMLGTGFMTALFGLTAYGTVPAHLLVGLFVFACFSFPLVLLISFVLAWISCGRGKYDKALRQLCLPLPHITLFVGLVIWFLVASMGPITRQVSPQSVDDFYRNARNARFGSSASECVDKFTKVLEKAEPRTPVSLAARLGRAFSYANANKNREAIADYKMWIVTKESLPPSNLGEVSVPDVICSIAYLYNRDKDYDDAMRLLNEAIQNNISIPEAEKLLKARAKVYKSMGNEAAAAIDLHAIGNQPVLMTTYPNVHPAVKNVSQQAGQPKELSVYVLDPFGYLINE